MASDIEGYSSFDKWSMTNIPQESAKCWFHLLGIFIMTAITIYFLEREFVIYAKYRHIYLRQTHSHLRTVLVEGIPNKFRSPLTLATYFEVLYPGAIAHVKLAQNLKYLENLIEQRETCVAELERCLYANHNGYARPTIRVGGMVQSVDAIRYHTQRLDELNTLIAKEQAIARKQAEYDLEAPGNASSRPSTAVVDEFLRISEIDSVRKSFPDSKKVAKDAKERTVSMAAAVAREEKEQLEQLAADVAHIDAAYPSTSSSSGSSSSSDGKSGKEGREEDLESQGFSSYQQGPSSSTATSTSSTSDGGDKRMLLSRSATSTTMQPMDVESSDGFSDEDEEVDDFSYGGHIIGGHRQSYRTYKMTYSEWFWHIYTSPSLMTCWRTVREGRTVEDHDLPEGHHDGDDETVALISPPEERRLYLSKAFITFRTFAAATTARQVVHMQLAGRMSIKEAPEPSDVTWTNLYTTRKGTFTRRIIVETSVLFLIVIWIAPVTLLSFVFSEDALRSFSPWIDETCASSPFFEGIIEMFQPLAMVAIMNLLPPMLTFLAVIEGCTSFSVNQMRSYNRYFTFQIINVFLVTTIAGSVITTISEIYSDPGSAFELLGASLPKLGGFFTNYILVKALTGLGMEIMRLPALFSASFKQTFTSNVTPRDRFATPLFGAIRNPSNPGWFPYAKIYAQDMLLLVLSATYACISPLILIAGMLYFAGAAYVYKHQMLYVYEPIFETGGRWWPTMARCIVVALLFAQSTMVGMMVLKETYNEVYFLALIIALTSSYFYYMTSIYVPLASQLPLDMAMQMDRELAEGGVTVEEQRKAMMAGADDYLQPAIRVGPVKPNVEFEIEKKDFADI